MSTVVAQLRERGIPHEEAAPTLTLKDVSVRYAAGSVGVTGAGARSGTRGAYGAYALENVSFEVARGQRVAVVGPNGAGKSTLFKLIVGTVKPIEGQVHVFGHGPEGHICIGYVPQRNQIDWAFPVTVEDVVMMGRVGQIGLFRWPRRQDWDVVHNSLERVNAGHLADKQIGELSGGQQQRVFIARALAQQAELLLLDEPLAGLDVPSREAIFEILESLRPDGVTVLLATHDLNLAAQQFNEILLLNRQLIAYGQPSAVLTAENLLRAYGGHTHMVNIGDDTLVLADTYGDHR